MASRQADDNRERREARGGRTQRLLGRIALIEDAFLVILLSLMIAIAAAQILLRNFLDMGLAWGDQALRVLVLWVALIGAVAAARENKHITIDVLLRFLAEPAKAVSRLVVGLFTASVCAVVAIHAGRFVYLDYEAATVAFGDLPLWVIELILPVGFGLIALRYLLASMTRLKHLITGEGGI